MAGARTPAASWRTCWPRTRTTRPHGTGMCPLITMQRKKRPPRRPAGAPPHPGRLPLSRQLPSSLLQSHSLPGWSNLSPRLRRSLLRTGLRIDRAGCRSCRQRRRKRKLRSLTPWGRLPGSVVACWSSSSAWPGRGCGRPGITRRCAQATQACPRNTWLSSRNTFYWSPATIPARRNDRTCTTGTRCWRLNIAARARSTPPCRQSTRACS